MVAMVFSFLSASSLAESVYSTKRPVVVDARSFGEYAMGHLPGAIWIDWQSFCQAAPADAGAVLGLPGYWGVLADPGRARFAARLSSLGLNNEDQIVVYGGGPASKGSDGRVAWLLLYLGASRVSLVQDGWAGWLAARQELSTRPTVPAEGEFAITLDERRRITLAEITALDGSSIVPVLIDTRSVDEYSGLEFDYQPRKGRLPGSQLLPFEGMFDSNGAYLGKREYLSWLGPDLAAVRQVVAYCEVGVRASSFALMHEAYTGTIVAVYDGSIMEWAYHRQLPVLSDVNTCNTISQPTQT